MAEFTTREKLDMIRSILWSKRQWLETYNHGRHKRPEHEVQLKRREVTVLDAIVADYQKKAQEEA